MHPRIRRGGAGAAAIVVLGGAMVGAGGANAALWGYVDEHGVPHYASEPLDARYRLFFKGNTSLDRPADTARADERAALERTTLYKRVVNHPNARRYATLIDATAAAYGLDAALLRAMIAVESGFEPTAVSDKGAVGLMQVLPDTGERYGVAGDRRGTVAQKLRDPALNLRIGARYLRDLLAMFADDVTLALAAYNAGEAAVRQYGDRVPPYPETQGYVELVRQFRELYRPPTPAPRAPARPTLDLPGKRMPGSGRPAE